MGIAIMLRGKGFTGKNIGKVHRADSVSVFDFDIVTDGVKERAKVELCVYPVVANNFKFTYTSSEPTIADFSGDTLIVFQDGSVEITVADAISGISKTKTIDVTASDEYIVYCNKYVYTSCRYINEDIVVGNAIKFSSDNGQGCTRDGGVPIPSWANKVVVEPMLWWVSSAGAARDSPGIVFVDNSNIVIKKYNFRDLFTIQVTGNWNKNDEFELEIPSGATKVMISTSNKMYESLYIEPVLKFIIK